MARFLSDSNNILIDASGNFLNNGVLISEPILTDPDSWTRYAGNPVLHVGSGWDANWIHPYTVTKLHDGYVMYYGGSPSGGTAGIPLQVGIATSPDGIVWSKYANNPMFSYGSAGQWDDSGVEHFCVVKEKGDWHAWYAGDPGGRAWSIGYATSTDGVTWSKYGGNPIINPGTGGSWDSGFIVPSCILKEENIYYMFYWGGSNPNDSTTWQAGYATSTDKINWTKYAGNPIFSGIVDEWDDGILDYDVINVSGTYYMFYQGNVASGATSAIGVATSTDKVNWSRAATNPFPRGANGTWDDEWNEGPTLIYKLGFGWMMYYMGQPGSGPMEIGLMTSF